MAKSKQKDQRKKEKQKAKRASRKRDIARHQNAGTEVRIARASKAPVLHSLVPGNIWESGMGQVLISRELPNRQVAFAVFLVDTFCLGVKDAHAGIQSYSDYEQMLLEPLRERYDMWQESPAYVRKLVEGSVAYAAQFKLSAHADYHKARPIFGDIDATECDVEFEFGRNGKPLYINGPYETAERSRLIMSNLSEFGSDSWNVLLADGQSTRRLLIESADDDDADDEVDDEYDIIEEPGAQPEKPWFWSE